MTSSLPVGDQSFGFLIDEELREDLEDALLFASSLIDLAEGATIDRHREEFNRVIILYLAAIVEALCLSFLARANIKGVKIDYKNILPVNLPEVVVADGELIIAVRKSKLVDLKQVPFAQAINLLHQNKLVNLKLKNRLTALRVRRNSQHLYGRGESRVSRRGVSESARTLEILLLTIKNYF